MKKHLPLLLTAIWLAAISVCLGVCLVYEYTSGGDGPVPGNWPGQSKIPRAAGKPTLVMFAHPKCPCTRASIGELMALMTHCQNQVDAFVVFLRPKDSGENWLQTDLWRSAAAIPGVTVRADEEGREAAYFQVATSGHVVLYGSDGKLLFSGGITSSRGHSGDNAGRTDITELIHHQVAGGWATPVFGCSLLDPKSECRTEAGWKR